MLLLHNNLTNQLCEKYFLVIRCLYKQVGKQCLVKKKAAQNCGISLMTEDSPLYDTYQMFYEKNKLLLTSVAYLTLQNETNLLSTFLFSLHTHGRGFSPKNHTRFIY